jgi:hypothetical protein
MRRGRSTGKPTPSQLARWDKIKDPDFGTGCIVAHILGIGWLPATIHHLTIGGHHGQKRRGHDATIGLNEWSHLGKPLDGWTVERCERELGPSYAHDPNGFRERFGDDDYLLQLQNELIGDK